MSSHFNYEINEAKLRERLNNLEAAANEEAWQKFQEFANVHPLNQKRTVIPSFQINLNRNIILPFVFGTVIIAFSFLLFNFVSIKKKTEVKTAETVKPKPQAKPEPKKKIIPLPEIKKDTVKIAAAGSVAEKTVAPVLPPPAQISETLQIKPEPAITVNEQGNYTAVTSGNIYISPNKASETIGNFPAGRSFQAVEETVYFIKVNSGNLSGYVMKSQLNRKGKPSPVFVGKKQKKAEILQPNQTQFITSEEKEAELR